MKLDAFLEWEERQEERWEFDGFAPVAMVGGTEAHELIQANLVTALTSRLRGGPCRAFGAGLKIEVAGRIRYPDALIVCSPIMPRSTVRRDPVVVFEILSPGTEHVDRGHKLHDYLATPSIARYVLIEQAGVGVSVLTRLGARWAGPVLWAGDAIPLPEAGIELPVDELYAGLALDADG